MKKILQILFVGLFFANFANAQDRTITGTVTGREDKLPLPGVTVRLKGAKGGAQTNSAGKYSLDIPSGVTGIEFIYLGYETLTKSLPSNNVLNVTLEVSSNSLNEVQVNGYSTILKRESTSSTAQITGDKISNLPVTSFDQSLGGRVAGVQINNSSGLVGAPVTIRIRGISSLTLGIQPLIVVDGVPITQGNIGQLYNPANALSDINPNDIESLDVLKDASATSLYGSRGANGVIVITTKQGKTGTAKVSYDTYFGFNEPSKKIEVLNGEQYNTVINQKRANAKLGNLAAYGDYDGDGTVDVASTDWQDEVYRKGFIMSHDFSISSATEKTSVFASASYLNYDNYIQVNGSQRGSARINVTHKVTDWFTVGINSQYSRNYQKGLGSGSGGAYSGVPYGPFFYYPNVPVSVNGDYYYGKGGNTGTIGSLPNPVAVLNKNYDNYDTKRFLGSGFAEVKLLPGLKLRTTYGVDYQTGFTTNYWTDEIGDGSGLGGLVQDVYNEALVWNWANTITYNKVIAQDHTINFLGGAEYNKNTTKWFYASALGASDPFYNQFVGSAFTQFGADGGLGANGFDSYFASANYSYKQKYLATATFRADAYSGYGSENKRGGFPSAALAWRFTEEDFLKNISFLSEGKLRASYGLTGNSNIGNFPALGVYKPVTYADLGGSALATPSNTALKWEKTKQLDIGLDVMLFKKLNLVLDYYDKKTNDLVLRNPVPSTLGFVDNILTQNLGEISNKGFEFTAIISPFNSSNFQWNMNFNVSYNKTKTLSTNTVGDDVGTTYSLARPGHEIGSFYLIRWAGVNSQTGLAQFLDINGKVKMYDPSKDPAVSYTDPTTGEVVSPITSSDRVLLDKSYFPKFQGGFSNDFRYKSFDLSVFLQFAADFYVYDATRRALLGQTNLNNSTEILDSWTTVGQVTDNQKLFYGDPSSTQASTRWLEKGDFIRAKNIMLGYTLPAEISKKLSLSRLRIYAQVQNAFTITGYKGTNPEASSNSSSSTASNVNIGGGVDAYTPYIARTWSLGLNVGF